MSVTELPKALSLWEREEEMKKIGARRRTSLIGTFKEASKGSFNVSV
ncbi:MAG: hypothetical protein LBU03_02365 [Tannerellaceae bacterium]|nr:hypothetical protein [Tannerellaceae bacterium]